MRWTTQDAADALLLTTQRISQLVREGVLSSPGKDGFDPKKLIQQYLRYKAASKEEAELAHEQTRLTRAKAELAEIELRTNQGILVRVDHVVKFWSRMISDCRSRLLALPTRAAPLMFASKSLAEARALHETLIEEALHELTELKPTDYARGFMSQAMGPAAAVDRKQVGRRKTKTQSRKQRRGRPMAHRSR